MKRTRTFQVDFFEPLDFQTRFLRACDVLEPEGCVGVKRSTVVTLKVKQNCTQEQWDRQPEALKIAHESYSYRDVQIQEI